MSESIWLQTVQPRLATRRAADHYNERAGDYNRLCNGYEFRANDRREAARDIDGARPLIAAAAIEDIERVGGGAALTRRTQELLGLLGYNPGVADGAYGAKTKVAIETFQREAGVSVDGLPSQELLEQLRRAFAGRGAARAAGRDSSRFPSPVPQKQMATTVDVAVRVMAATEAVSGAAVKISSDRGFQDDQVTNERGSAVFAAVPAGKVDIDVRRNEERSRFTFRITAEPRQEVLILLSTPDAAPR
jgi:peptidoglycan hydrolase-like protein with peptidoglycan-binding domain